MVDKDLARTKLTHIASNLALLDSKSALPLENFLTNVDQQYVVLHALQLAIQAAMDLAAHFVADEGWEVPARSGQVFSVLAERSVISAEIASRLRTMAAFRNLIVHEYGEVNLKTVYEIWHRSLDDLREFAAAVMKDIESDESV